MDKNKMQELKEKVESVANVAMSVMNELENIMDSLPEDDSDCPCNNPYDNDDSESVAGNNRGKFVCRNDGHLFFHAKHGDKKLRFHMHPDGHFNIQTGDNIGTTKVDYKGSLA